MQVVSSFLPFLYVRPSVCLYALKASPKPQEIVKAAAGEIMAGIMAGHEEPPRSLVLLRSLSLSVFVLFD